MAQLLHKYVSLITGDERRDVDLEVQSLLTHPPTIFVISEMESTLVFLGPCGPFLYYMAEFYVVLSHAFVKKKWVVLSVSD